MVSKTIKPQLQSVHFVRAIASLLVAIFHLYCGNVNLFPEGGHVKTAFSYGYLGVEMFFLLSGFIICYALPLNYSYGDFKPFILKRLIRIEPPYFLSIILVLVLNTVSHKITNSPNPVDWGNVLLHLAYLSNFGIGEYLNVVYWTLGVEFQFYLIIAFLFPLIENSKMNLYLVLAVFLCLSCIEIPGNIRLISPYLSIFGLGILLYFYNIRKKVSSTGFLVSSILLLLQVYFFLGLPETIACIFSILVLLFWQLKHRLISFFSAISFSLYLTHTNIGGKVINLGLRVVHTDLERHLLFLLALLISIGFAYLFYLLIEKPAMTFSKKIHYKIRHAS